MKSTISVIRDRLDQCQGWQPFGTAGQPTFFNFIARYVCVAYNDNRTRDDVVRGGSNEVQGGALPPLWDFDSEDFPESNKKIYKNKTKVF